MEKSQCQQKTSLFFRRSSNDSFFLLEFPSARCEASQVPGCRLAAGKQVQPNWLERFLNHVIDRPSSHSLSFSLFFLA